MDSREMYWRVLRIRDNYRLAGLRTWAQRADRALDKLSIRIARMKRAS